MIIGLGTDIVNIDRIKATIDRFGERFEKKIFTNAERLLANKKFDTIKTFASKWAAKEACSKALGTGISKGICWNEMSIENNEFGKPIINLSGIALKRLKDITPENHFYTIHLSLTEDSPWAHATVVIEAVAYDQNYR